MDTIIEVKNLTKKYQQNEVVKDISFSIEKGEIFGLLGPNGAGKTTTLEIIETLKSKTSGTIKVDGMDIDEHPQQVKQIIGVQLQSCNFYPALNLIELLHLFASLYNVSIDAMEILEKVDLVSKSRAKYNQLSGGQKQRFSIATTLLHHPKIIFLDEPTTGLDPHARRNLWHLIQQIRSEGTTIVLTTHYLDEAEFLCDRVGIIDNGKIIAINTPLQLIDDLIASGFERKTEVKKASLDDVFIHLTGKSLASGV